MKKFAVLSALIALCVASPTQAAQQPKMFGVMDDGPYACLASQAGFGFIKKTVWITPGNWHLDSLDQGYLKQFDADMQQASDCGMQVILQLWPVPKYGLPKSSTQKRGTCDVAKDLAEKYPQVRYFEIGLEPNSYRFGGNQFVNGINIAAPAYTDWLATCYTTLKKVNPDIMVIGGSLASRGDDDFRNPRSGTSPVRFIQKMCEAYSASRRTLPLMDIFDMHSYPVKTDEDPRVQHPYPSTTITIADGGKLEDVLSCFKGTAQPIPPYIWGEAGYNSRIPNYQMYRYTPGHQKPASVKPVDEVTQGRYIAAQIQMAYCDRSLGYANLHIVDDPDLKSDWQSGLVYAPNHQERAESSASTNYTHKLSWQPVSNILKAIAGGSLKCG